jgi:hypothetical protein
MTQPSYTSISRRRFLGQTAAGAAVSMAPAIHTSAKTDSEIIIGEGEHRFQVTHNWPRLPDRFQWQTTHNAAVDRDGFLYVIHEGRAELKDHPAIFVFDPEGTFRAGVRQPVPGRRTRHRGP